MRKDIVGFVATAFLVISALMCGDSISPRRCLAACPGCPSCCSLQPMLEMAPGQSLYWHNPCEPTEDPCHQKCCPGGHLGWSPVWYATAEYLGLFRYQEEVSFQSLPELDEGAIVLSTMDFDAEMASGTRVLIGRALGQWYRIEGSYFGSHFLSDGVAVRNDDANAEGGTGTLFSPFSGFGVPDGVLGLDYNDFASIEFTSRLNSAEINLRRRLAHARAEEHHAEASVIVGLRYMDIAETFGYFTQANVPAPLGATNQVDISADNDMFGAQIGFLAQLLIGERGWIDFEVKGGIFANDAKQQTVYTNVDNDGIETIATGGDNEDVTSYVVDLALALNYQVAPSMTFRVGYNAIFVMDVALAAENFNTDVNTLLLGPADIHHGGNLVYHGPNIGFTWAR